MTSSERRRARRIKVEIPTAVEAIAAVELPLSDALQAVYERVVPALDYLGRPTLFTVRDVSSNGAFLEGPPLSLLSRVRFKLPFGDGQESDAIGWVMWRRTAPCRIDGPYGKVQLEPGIGVLFEAFPLEVRLEIARRASAAER
jgi:hypothetical protein